VHAYIFLVSRLTGPDGLSPEQALSELKRTGRWQISAKTRHLRELRESQEALFYVTGGNQQNAKHVVARGYIAGTPYPSPVLPSSSWLGVNVSVWYTVPITNLQFFDQPVPLQSLVRRLRFVRNPDSWGSSLLGSITKIPIEDFERITAASKK
jgi:hypothetical protein